MKRLLLLLLIVLGVAGVSAQKIADLPRAAIPAATDLVILDQTDATRAITVAALLMGPPAPWVGLFPDGTAAAPGGTFWNDLDVGFFRPGADILGFSIGGVEGFRLTEVGSAITAITYGDHTINDTLFLGNGEYFENETDGEIHTNASFEPQTTVSHDLGAPDSEWHGMYSDDLYVSDSAYIDTLRVDGYALIDALTAGTITDGTYTSDGSGNFTGIDNLQADSIYTDSLKVDGEAVLDKATISDGTISGTDVTVGAGKTLDVSAGTLTLADNQISGDKVEGGTIAATTITALTAGTVTASGVLTGLTQVTLDVAASVVLASTDCDNAVRFNNDADVIDYTLPGAAAGLVVMFYDIGGGVITVDPVDGTDHIYLNGTGVGAGDAIDSPGDVGDFICLMAIDATRWVTVGRSGTWVDGGAD